MSEWEYPEGPYQSYEGGAVFIRVCPECGRFAVADKTILVNEETGLKKAPNGTCKRHGRIEMPFMGFIGD